MNCAVCQEPMIVLELEQVEIDHCLNCGGTWLDAGELELLVAGATEAHELIKQLDGNSDSEIGKRKCPICLRKMEIITVGTTRKVRLDRCQKHHGIWFDKGELEEVLTIFDPARHGKALKVIKDMFGKVER